MKQLLDRSEINELDCWDKTKIIKDEKEYETLKKIVLEKNKEILKMKGHILDNEKTLLQYLKTSEEESRALERLIVYSKFLFDEDTRNNDSKNYYLEIESLSNEISESESFVLSEFMLKDLEYVETLFEKEEKLNIYKRYFEEIYKDKKRILGEKEEEIISKALSAFGTPDDTFTSLDTTDAIFDTINVEKEEIELTHYNYTEFLDNKDQNVRKKAFLSYHDYYKKHKNTFASLLKGNYQELEFLRSIRKYDSALEMALDSIHVPKEVYTNLISSVHRNIDIFVEYQKLKKKMLGLEEYHLYDTYVSTIEKPVSEYTKEEAIQTVTEALKPLGHDYLDHFKSIFENKTVDFYPNIGKYSGAYHWGCYDSPSYVLLNFNGTIDSVGTLAHELGHAVHSMYSKENNPYIYAGYDIFVAEIASTVNEVFFSHYMRENAKTKEEKIYYLCEFLDRVKATIYRQTMFSEFESKMSEKLQNKESLTESTITDTYYELNKEYFKDSVIIDDSIRYECLRIPHFYTPFYVYKYATGLISAICIANDILNGTSSENYLNFLKSGSSKNVLDILKIVNVDLTDEKTFEKAFKYIEKCIEELNSLVGEKNE